MTNGRVVTLTMNPALDLSTMVGEVVPFQKLRCAAPRRDPGGGGINVARVVCRFGLRATAIFPIGGPIGQILAHLVSAECVESITVPIAGDTREDFTVFEGGTNKQFRFVMPGPSLSEAERGACLDVLAAALRGAAYCVVSGSLPPGVADSFFADVARIAKSAGTKLVLDTTGGGLRAALPEGVALIKPNLNEFCDLVGRTLPDTAAMIAAARVLIAENRVETIALSLAEGGALLIGRDMVLRAQAPKVVAVSTVGAGDSFLGAMIASLVKDQDWRNAFRQSVAAGSAALLSPGTDLAHPDAVQRLAAEVIVETIA